MTKSAQQQWIIECEHLTTDQLLSGRASLVASISRLAAAIVWEERNADGGKPTWLVGHTHAQSLISSWHYIDSTGFRQTKCKFGREVRLLSELASP
jgi:hypothetical protein